MPPGFKVPLVALVAVQFSVAVQPTEMAPVALFRLPEGAPLTVTVVVATAIEAEPQGAVTVKVYVVVPLGPVART